MLGLEAVVALAHRSEDMLGQLRDGRLVVRRDLVDLLLVASEALGRALPGAERPVGEQALADIAAAFDQALAGVDPVTVPRLSTYESVEDAVEVSEGDDEEVVAEPVGPTRAGEHVRVPTQIGRAHV